MGLGKLEFVDLYLGRDFADLKGLKGSPNLRDAVPKKYHSQLGDLWLRCRMQATAEKEHEFSLVLDGVMFRVTMVRDVTGTEVFVLRRSSAQLRPIEQVGIAPALVRQILSRDLRGLILIAGETGAGKTSTAAAILKSRLDIIGGIAVTIEDPPEVNLNGIQGRGRCMQVRASRRTGGYKEHLVRALRMNPDMILLGEVREEAAAEEVISASLNGHFIITTIHAASVSVAIERLALLARGTDPNPKGIYNRLAAGLKLVIWQELVRNPEGGEPAFSYEALTLVGEQASGARAKIASGNLGHLVQDVDQLMIRLNRNPTQAL